MTRNNPIRDLVEPLSGRSKGSKGSGITPDAITRPPRDELNIRAGAQRKPLPSNLARKEQGPDEGWG
jgi:hypothetical protein